MLLDSPHAAGTEQTTFKLAEHRSRRNTAGFRCCRTDVRLQPGRAQPLACPAGQLCHRTSTDLVVRGQGPRRMALHLGQPQHLLPLLRQCTECRGHQPSIQARLHVVTARQVRQGRLDIIDWHLTATAHDIGAEVAHGAQQVGHELLTRTTPLPHRTQHSQERLLSHVLRLDAAHELAGIVHRGGVVPAEEGGVAVQAATPDHRDESRVVHGGQSRRVLSGHEPSCAERAGWHSRPCCQGAGGRSEACRGVHAPAREE